MKEYEYGKSYILTYIPLVILLMGPIVGGFFVNKLGIVMTITGAIGLVIFIIGYIRSSKETIIILEDRLSFKASGEERSICMFSQIRNIKFTRRSTEIGIIRDNKIKTKYISKYLSDYEEFKQELTDRLTSSGDLNHILLEEFL